MLFPTMHMLVEPSGLPASPLPPLLSQVAVQSECKHQGDSARAWRNRNAKRRKRSQRRGPPDGLQSVAGFHSAIGHPAPLRGARGTRDGAMAAWAVRGALVLLLCCEAATTTAPRGHAPGGRGEHRLAHARADALTPRSLGVAATARPTFRWMRPAGADGAPRRSTCVATVTVRASSPRRARGVVVHAERPLPPGLVYWRVRGVSSAGAGGAYSPLRTVVVPRRDAGTASGAHGVREQRRRPRRRRRGRGERRGRRGLRSWARGTPRRRLHPVDGLRRRSDRISSATTPSGTPTATGRRRRAIVGIRARLPGGDGGAQGERRGATGFGPRLRASPWVGPAWYDAEAAGLNGDGLKTCSRRRPRAWRSGARHAPTRRPARTSRRVSSSPRPMGAAARRRAPTSSVALGTTTVTASPTRARAGGHRRGVHPYGPRRWLAARPRPGCRAPSPLRGAASDGSNVAAPADVNSDGYEDLVAASQTLVRQVEVFLAAPTGLTPTPTLFTVPARPGGDLSTETVVFGRRGRERRRLPRRRHVARRDRHGRPRGGAPRQRDRAPVVATPRPPRDGLRRGRHPRT